MDADVPRRRGIRRNSRSAAAWRGTPQWFPSLLRDTVVPAAITEWHDRAAVVAAGGSPAAPGGRGGRAVRPHAGEVPSSWAYTGVARQLRNGHLPGRLIA